LFLILYLLLLLLGVQAQKVPFSHLEKGHNRIHSKAFDS